MTCNPPENSSSEQTQLPIGLFDSGVGGLSVLKQLMALMPHEDFIYLGDTARTPYGTRSHSTIVQYSDECVNFLIAQKVKFIVVACNTASSAALPQLVKSAPCPVVGMIGPASSRAIACTKGRVAVLGTRATIKSNAYQMALRDLNADLEIVVKECPLFVPLVEEGILKGPLVDSAVELYLKELRSLKPDTIILACTHYPLLRAGIESYFGSTVSIIDCGEASAQTVYDMLSKGKLANNKLRPGNVKYFVTDAADRFKEIATLFLGITGMEVSVAEV